MAVDSHGMPVRLFITEGAAADCNYAIPLIEGIFAEHLLADRGYDSNNIISQAIKQGIDPVIPPKKNRRNQREYDKYLYKLRHLVENAFLQVTSTEGCNFTIVNMN